MVIDWILTLLQYIGLLIFGFIATVLIAVVIIFFVIMIKVAIDYIRGRI